MIKKSIPFYSSEKGKSQRGFNRKERVRNEGNCYNAIKSEWVIAACADKYDQNGGIQQMKKQKKWIALGLTIFTAVAAVVAGVTAYTRTNQFDLTVGGHKISQDEYINCMKAVQYDTKAQIQQEYGVQYSDGFWKAEYGDRYGYEILMENTIEELKYCHAVYDVAAEYGDVSDGSYEALKERWTSENADRKRKIAEGQVVYGLKEYTFDIYQQYEMSIFKETYCNDDTRQGMDLTEEEIVEHYNSREWIFDKNEENADLETARVAVKRELREIKYEDMIRQIADDSLVTCDIAKITQFTLKNI